MAIYRIWNFALPTTAAPVPVTTGTAIKTMLQYKASATLVGTLIEWGYYLDSSAGAVSMKIELGEFDVAATVTAHVASGIVKYDALALLGGDPTTNLIPVGTTSTGYTSTAEGTPTDSRLIDAALETASISFAANRLVQKPLGREGVIQVGKFARIRVTSPTAVGMLCYMDVQL